MIDIKTISTPSMACTISIFESHWTQRHFSNDAWTNLQHLQEVFKNCGSVCVQCIPISVNMIAWHCMRACHEELTLCWKVGVTWSITKEFVGNLNIIEYFYIVFHLALQHTYLLSIMWVFAYMCTSLCSIISNFQIWKRASELFVVVCWRWLCSKCNQFCS